MRCRMCHGDSLVEYLDLGYTPAADAFLDSLDEPETWYPLRVALCQDCGLSQLTYTVPPDVLFQNGYPYVTSTTESARAHWGEFARSTIARYQLNYDDLVIDIGSNIGVLLAEFMRRGISVLGVEPAKHIAQMAAAQGIPTLDALWSQETAERLTQRHPQAAVITACNVFAHVDNLDGFMRGVDAALAPDGVLIIELPWFVNLVRHMEYDTIYHEHVSYVTLKPLIRFMSKHGFGIFDVEQVDIHGGGIRIHCARGRDNHPVPKRRVYDLMDEEDRAGVRDIETLVQWAAKVRENQRYLRLLLVDIAENGDRVVAVSAPAKGMTLLNTSGIGRDLVDYVTESSPLKIGKYTPGAHLPVYPDARLIDDQPDYALLLAWNFADEIMANVNAAGYRGKWIIPVPEPHVVDGGCHELR